MDLFFFSFFFVFFPAGVDASHVYVRAWALGCFQSYQYPNFSEGADRVGGQLRGDRECLFNGVTKSGRVWRKLPESDARCVGQCPYNVRSIAVEEKLKQKTSPAF